MNRRTHVVLPPSQNSCLRFVYIRMYLFTFQYQIHPYLLELILLLVRTIRYVDKLKTGILGRREYILVLVVMETLQVGDLTKESQKSNKRIKKGTSKETSKHLQARLMPIVHFPEQPNWRLLACPMFLHRTRHHSHETIIVLFAPRKTKAGVGWSRTRRGKIVFVHFYET